MSQQGAENVSFSGDTIGQVPVEVAQKFGELMEVMRDQLQLHLEDPERYPITEDMKQSYIHLFQTGGILAEKMFTEGDK